MRETSKLLAAALLTLCLIVLGPATGPGEANATHAKRHHRAAVQHHRSGHAVNRSAASHNRVRRARQPDSPTPRTRRREATPVTPDRRAAKPRETSADKTAGQGAATIAAVLATPCQSTEVTPAPANLPLVREAVLCLINRVRAEHGLVPLTRNAQLEAAAEGHCSELIADDYFAHVAPDGETPVDRIKQAGYIGSESFGYVIGENLAWGTYGLATPRSIVAAWVASPGHLANILEGRYRDTGIGVDPAVPQSLGEGNQGATYAQEFGVIIH